MVYNSNTLNTKNGLLLNNLMIFYTDVQLNRMVNIINGNTRISLRIADWFVLNYAKKYYTVYPVKMNRFKVYTDYKLNLKAYSKKNFDIFCRWDRISVPFRDVYIETTIGQLNFFKWAIENNVIDFIEENYTMIEQDMIMRNKQLKRGKSSSTTSTNTTASSIDTQNTDDSLENVDIVSNGKTRKRREEISTSACKCIKKEMVKIIMKF
jgi:hypothetical protein